MDSDGTPTLDTIRDSWGHLRELLYKFVHNPTKAKESLMMEEAIKFDCIVHGRFHDTIALFRDTLSQEYKAHEKTKAKLERLEAEISKLYAAQYLPPSPPGPSPPGPSQLNERFPSVINITQAEADFEDEDKEWGGEYCK